MEHCIEGDAEISSKAVDQDVKKLDTEAQNCPAEGRVLTGMNTVDNSIQEGTVYYDICFSACVPGEKEPIRLIINLEIQQNTHPGYPLVKRGFYYCSRLISAQKGSVFTGDNYEKLRKVYSIWICPKPAKKAENVIRRYRTIEELLPEGADKIPREVYDLTEVIILTIAADKETAERKNRSGEVILNFLSVLFSNKITAEEKKNILQNEYHIKMTEEFKGDVNNMCNLSQLVWNEGRESGFSEGHASGVIEGQERGRMEERLNAIRRMKENLMLTAEQAMDVLGIPREERAVYLNA